MDLVGKVAIVTGGASGLGEATVDAYVAKGAKVAIFDMNEARANAVIEPFLTSTSLTRIQSRPLSRTL